MTKKLDIFALILLGVLHHCNGIKNYSIELETSLRAELFTNYSIKQRPTKTVGVSVSFTILTINDLNIKDQTLSMTGYLTLEWSDYRLAWDNPNSTTEDYTSVSFLFATEDDLWRPSIIIENAVDGLAVIRDTAIPMRITPNGKIHWNPIGIYKVSCESDTRYYPMDTQQCYLKISSWAYTISEIKLKFKSDPVDTSDYTVNGEWALLSVAEYWSTDRKRDGNIFSSISFEIRVKRRLLFHIVNTLFPVALMAILIAFVFKLPVDSGEKIGFSLTVLLSYAVYLSLISDNIPSTSTTVCYLSLYLAFILLLATVAVCCSTLVINLHMREEEKKMSPWVKHFSKRFLTRIACWKQGCFCRRRKVKHCRNKFDAGEAVHNGVFLEKTGNLTDDQLEMPRVFTNETRQCVKMGKDYDMTWKELSEIVDKVFFNIYMLLICVSTAILFFLIVIGYTNEG